MKRRQLIQASAAAAALGVPHLSGLAQQSVTLKFATFVAPTSNPWLGMLKPWMDKVEKESAGRIKFEGYSAARRRSCMTRRVTVSPTSSGRCPATQRGASLAPKSSSCRS
jgi:hypothetical protein